MTSTNSGDGHWNDARTKKTGSRKPPKMDTENSASEYALIVTTRSQCQKWWLFKHQIVKDEDLGLMLQGEKGGIFSNLS
jgi:hypothetical protein